MVIFIFLLLIILLILLMAFIIINCRCCKKIVGGNFSKIGGNFSKIGDNFSKIGGNQHRFYYTISGEHNGLDFSKLRNILSEYNFHPKPISEAVHVSFGTFYAYGRTSSKDNYNPLFIKQHAAIKNVLNGHNAICDKTLFYKTIKSLIPMSYKYIPQTYTVEEFDRIYSDNIDGNNVYILKKKNSAQQKGILVFSTMKEYLAAKKELNIHKDNGIVSKYITNPLTVDGKKMHLRVYILVTIHCGITRCYIYDTYKIYNAEDVYIQQDWSNSKIHISGPNSMLKQYIWPDDVFRSVSGSVGGSVGGSPPEELLNNMNECLRLLCQGIALSKLSHYEESYSGYQLYGADILLTNDNKAYILEVNKKPGFKWVKDSSDKNFSHNLFVFILNSAVFPFLGIKRLQNPIAEVCKNGQLLPFTKGLNFLVPKYILIPIGDATQDELSSSKLQLDKTNYSTAEISNKYLIAQNSRIIGSLVLINNWINIYIIKEFQHHGIDIDMIGILMEIQAYRNYPHNPTIYIKIDQLHNLQSFIDKLKFKNEHTFLSRKCIIKN